MPNFLDLFAGAGGLSEGFVQAGYEPVAHVEMDEAACFTLKTRAAFHYLNATGRRAVYNDYLERNISRKKLYSEVSQGVLDTVLHYEISEETLSEIFGKVHALLGDRKLDLIIGGPPCQAYSVVGRARTGDTIRDDKRNFLYQFYADFLKEFQPYCFVFENVTGLLSAKDKDGSFHLQNMIDSFNEAGYELQYKVLEAADYGVLQTRRRLILVGRQQRAYWPDLQEWDPGCTVREIFDDLPVLQAGQGTASPVDTRDYQGDYLIQAGIRDSRGIERVTYHTARPNRPEDLKIYRLVVQTWNDEKRRMKYTELPEELKFHRNQTSFTDRFKVVAADLPFAQTVVAHLAKDGHYYIHPDIRQNRSITPREAARLQTFPDNYWFESVTGRPSRTLAFRQIGNAVPVLLARRIAEGLLSLFASGPESEV